MRLVNVLFEYPVYKHYAFIFVLRCNILIVLWGTMPRGLFCYCYHLLFPPRTPLLQSKPSPPFQAVNKNQGLCNIFPRKRTKKNPSQLKNKRLEICNAHISQSQNDKESRLPPFLWMKCENIVLINCILRIFTFLY